MPARIVHVKNHGAARQHHTLHLYEGGKLTPITVFQQAGRVCFSSQQKAGKVWVEPKEKVVKVTVKAPASRVRSIGGSVASRSVIVPVSASKRGKGLPRLI